MSQLDDLASCIRLGIAGVRVMEALRRRKFAVLSAILERRPHLIHGEHGGRRWWSGLPPSLMDAPGRYRLTIGGRRFPVAGLLQLIRHGMAEPLRRRWNVRARFRLTGTPEHLRKCLVRIFAAATPAMLERQTQAGWKRFGYVGLDEGGPHRALRTAMRLSGERLCSRHKLGRLVPRFNTRTRILMVGRASYRVGRGFNSSGVRWVWGHAEWWYLDVLKRRGVKKETAERAWSWWMAGFPHRALRVLVEAGVGS